MPSPSRACRDFHLPFMIVFLFLTLTNSLSIQKVTCNCYLLHENIRAALRFRTWRARLCVVCAGEDIMASSVEDPSLERSFRGHRDTVTGIVFHTNMKQVRSRSRRVCNTDRRKKNERNPPTCLIRVHTRKTQKSVYMYPVGR